MQRTGQTLPCQAPSRPSYIPGHPSLNRRCNIRSLCQKHQWNQGAVSGLRPKPEPRYRPLVDGEMTLDSGLRRNDGQGIMLHPDIFEHSL